MKITKLNTKPAILLILLFTPMIYINSLLNGFVYDDSDLVVHNSWIRSVSGLSKIFNPFGRSNILRPYRPMREASYTADYAVWRLSPFGFHLTNILLHTFNAILLFIILIILTRNRVFALFSAILFAAHPAATESVSWISGRKELLCLLFTLLAFIAFHRFISSTKVNPLLLAISLLLYMASILSKETGLALFFIFVLTPFFYDKYEKKRIVYSTILYFFIFSILLFFFIYIGGGGIIRPEIAAGFFLRFLLSATIFFRYLFLLFVPYNLNVEHYYPLADSVTFLHIFFFYLLLCLIFLAWRYRKKLPNISFGFLWILVFLVPALNLIPLSNIMAERFLYLPLIGFAICIGSFLEHFSRRNLKSAISVFFAITALYSCRTFIRNYDWKDNFTLWSKAVSQTPESPRAIFNLAREHLLRDELEKAEILFNRFNSMVPADTDAYNYLGIIQLKKGDFSRAEKMFRQSLEYNPANIESRVNLGNMYFNMKDMDKAEKEYKQALVIRRDIPEALYNIGNIYTSKIDKVLTGIDFKKIKPSSKDDILDYPVLEELNEAMLKAMAYYKEAMHYRPEYIKAAKNLAHLFKEVSLSAQKMQLDELSVHFKKKYEDIMASVKLDED